MSKKATCKQKLAAVEKAFEEYYRDLDEGRNTVAYTTRTLVIKIENALELEWGKSAKDS